MAEGSGCSVKIKLTNIPRKERNKNIGIEETQACGDDKSELLTSSCALGMAEESSLRHCKVLKISLNQVEKVRSESKIKVPMILDQRSTPVERNELDFETALGHKNTPPILENWTDDDDNESGTEENSLGVEMYQLTHSEDSNPSTSDDDSADYTVSKYMESKISRLDEARFGVWKVKRAAQGKETCATDPGTINRECEREETAEVWQKAGTSSSSVSLPPLKLILKKALEGDQPEKPLHQEKPPKRKYKTKRNKSEPLPQKERRKPGRPSTNKSTKQRLLKLFKKKYFKDRKRWARSNSSCSMPPTIRSIAKP